MSRGTWYQNICNIIFSYHIGSVKITTAIATRSKMKTSRLEVSYVVTIFVIVKLTFLFVKKMKS